MEIKKGEKINPKEFPPTYEDEKIRAWDARKLDLKEEDMIQDAAMRLDEETEEAYEIRLYPMRDIKNFETIIMSMMRIMEEKDITPEKRKGAMEKIQKFAEMNTTGYLDGFDLRIISKINKETKLMTVIMRGRTFSMKPKHENIKEEEYRKLIADLETEPGFRIIYDISKANVCDKKYLDEFMRKSKLDVK